MRYFKRKTEITLRWIVLSIIACSGLLVGCGGNDTEGDAEVAVAVNVYRVSSGPIENLLRFTGDVRAQRDVRILSQVPNRIIDLRVENGDFVTEGQVLAVIENSILREAVESAQGALVTARVNLENIEREYNRTERLFAEEAVSRQQFDMISTQYESAKAALQQATAGYAQVRKQFDDSYIKAPFKGIISQRFLELGDMASPGIPVLSIVQVDTMKAAINVSEREYGMIAANQTARLKVASYPDTIFTGFVYRVSPILDPVSRLGRVEILFPNPRHKLISGSFGELEIVIDHRDNVPVIPTFAILYRTVITDQTTRIDERLQRIPYVYVAENDIAVRRDIVAGYQNGSFTEVRSGVTAGETVVVRGHQNLDAGDRIEIIDYIDYTGGGE
jgi:RND family efflux transporter MFP subunit